jgi:hypothetical protein
MKIIAIVSALIAGISLAAIQVRHAGSIPKAIFGMDHKWLRDKLDNFDKLLLLVAGTFFVVFLVATILVV